MAGSHSIRIPIHGFVEFSDWERDIINHPVFQRLRRIRQLAFSEHLFPGATHTRFEHSIGVMHVATKLYDALASRCGKILENRLGYGPRDARAQTLVRLAALLHDVGHAPFSHTGEELMPTDEDGQILDHEDYSAALIREEMRDVIDEHSHNKKRLHVTAKEVADFLAGESTIEPGLLFWKELVSSQLDADRMDYLLRDSYHCGCAYGQFDLDRLIDTITVVETKAEDTANQIRIGFEKGGMHAAEGLVLARYFMFTQVYFHPVRKAYDRHAMESLRLFLGTLLGKEQLPSCESESGRKEFLALDDWSVQEFIRNDGAGRHGHAILEHEHDRLVEETREVPSIAEIKLNDRKFKELSSRIPEAWEDSADKEWYKADRTDLQIADGTQHGTTVARAVPLSEISNVVDKIPATHQRLIFVPPRDVKRAKEILDRIK